MLFPDAALAQRISDLADIVTLGILIGFAIVLVHRAVAATPPARRAFGFVWVGGVVLCANLIVLVSAGLGVVSFDDAYGLWLEIVAGVVPMTMVLSLFASRVAEDRLVRLVVDLEAGERGEQLLASLRRALADPTLDLIYSLPEAGGWIHGDGRPAHVESDHTGDGRVVTPVVYGGAPIAAIVHDPVLLRSPERLATAAAAAAGLALDNERLQAELRAQVVDVQASRARIVEAGDRERRRVERNLHDGAQQRLVGLALTVRLAGRKAAGDPEVAELLAAAARETCTRAWAPAAAGPGLGAQGDRCERGMRLRRSRRGAAGHAHHGRRPAGAGTGSSVRNRGRVIGGCARISPPSDW